jgi:ribosomal protein L32E
MNTEMAALTPASKFPLQIAACAAIVLAYWHRFHRLKRAWRRPGGTSFVVGGIFGFVAGLRA